MKILYVCNYDAWNKIARDAMANHHLFGFSHWIKKWVFDDNGLVKYGVLKEEFLGGGEIYFIKIKSTYDIKSLKTIYELSKSCDFIYDTLNNCKLLGTLKKIGFVKCRLISIMHYPPFTKQLLVSKSDGYIFFNTNYKSIAIKNSLFKHNNGQFFVNEWKPDKRWYWKEIENNNIKPNSKYFFIDNGKTLRNHELLFKIADECNLPLLMCSEKQLKSDTVYTYQIDDFSDETLMIKKVYGANCMVIPAMPIENMGPIGITSFLDAIAYEIPVICSSNTCFSDEVKKYNLGIVYDVHNENELKEALLKMYKDESFYMFCKENMTKYSNQYENSLDYYSLNLLEIFKKIRAH